MSTTGVPSMASRPSSSSASPCTRANRQTVIPIRLGRSFPVVRRFLPQASLSAPEGGGCGNGCQTRRRDARRRQPLHGRTLRAPSDCRRRIGRHPVQCGTVLLPRHDPLGDVQHCEPRRSALRRLRKTWKDFNPAAGGRPSGGTAHESEIVTVRSFLAGH